MKTTKITNLAFLALLSVSSLAAADAEVRAFNYKAASHGMARSMGDRAQKEIARLDALGGGTVDALVPDLAHTAALALYEHRGEHGDLRDLNAFVTTVRTNVLTRIEAMLGNTFAAHGDGDPLLDATNPILGPSGLAGVTYLQFKTRLRAVVGALDAATLNGHRAAIDLPVDLETKTVGRLTTEVEAEINNQVEAWLDSIFAAHGGGDDFLHGLVAISAAPLAPGQVRPAGRTYAQFKAAVTAAID